MKIVFITLLCLLVACARQPDYIQATTLPPVETPPGVDKQRLGQLYPVPAQTGIVSDKNAVPFPPTVGAQDDANIASLQSLGNDLWVFNAKTPATTWAQLLSFLQQRNIALARRNLSQATLETGWFSLALQPGYEVRYQLRLEQGMQPDTTEIHFSNAKRVAESNNPALNNSNANLDDRIHANWFAQQLTSVLNDPNNVVGDSYLATTINLPQKMTLSSVEDEAVLTAMVDDVRLQQSLSRALSSDSFVLYDTDPESGVFHFDFAARDKPSFILRLFTWDDGQPPAKSDYTLNEILQSIPASPAANQLFPSLTVKGGKKLSGVAGYLLVLRSEAERTVIYLRDGYGKRLKADQTREILDVIRLRLI